MKCDERIMRLYAVTDRTWLKGRTLTECVEKSLRGGVTCVQLREKELSDAEFLREAIEIKALCQSYGVPFFVNDNVDVAIACGADGVHVGQSDAAAGEVRKRIGNTMMLGVSAQSVKQALAAQEMGADCLGVGAVFPTSTKADADSVDYETLCAICSAVDIPVVAIGGINKSNISRLAKSGISGVALVSAIFAAEDIESECKELLKMSEELL